MAKSVHCALTKHNCGKDLLIFASLIMALGANFGNFSQDLPESYKTKEGDVFGFIKLMKNVIHLKENHHNPITFDINSYINILGIKKSMVSPLNK